MKYYSTDFSKNGRGVTRFNFIFGKDELEIMIGLIDKALKYLPVTFSTRITQNRLRNMRKVMFTAFTDVLKKSK